MYFPSHSAHAEGHLPSQEHHHHHRPVSGRGVESGPALLSHKTSSGPLPPLGHQHSYNSSWPTYPSTSSSPAHPRQSSMSRPSPMAIDEYRTGPVPEAASRQQLPSLRTLLQSPPGPHSLELTERSASGANANVLAPSFGRSISQDHRPFHTSDFRRGEVQQPEPSGLPQPPPLNHTADPTRMHHLITEYHPPSAISTSTTTSAPTILSVGIANRYDRTPIPRPDSTSNSGFTGSPESAATPLHRIGMNGEAVEITRTHQRRRTDAAQRAPVRIARCVGQKQIDGEGLCFLYEDGTFCRTIIDGEAVNPSWGITKAGKPRKRLAQACLTCREKKIKCEPGIPKCVQCARSQRICRGSIPDEQSPPRSDSPLKRRSSEMLRSTYDSKSWEPIMHGQLPKVQRLSTESTNSPRSPINQHTPSHRSDGFPALPEVSVPSDTEYSSILAKNNHLDRPSPASTFIGHSVETSWETDPYEADAELTMRLLDLYLAHVNSATYGLFPEGRIRHWVATFDRKSQDDRMVLYAILAMGSVFSPDLQTRKIGRYFSSVAVHAAHKRFSKFSLQLCHSRLLISFYHFATGKSNEAWDYCGLALRAISGLKLHTEDGITDLQDDELDYGFDRSTLEECRRRTFWSGFLMDVGRSANSPDSYVNDDTQRYNGLYGGTLCVIRLEDTWLRLPCDEASYGKEPIRPSHHHAPPSPPSMSPRAPIFSLDTLDNNKTPRSTGRMANLAVISALWGEILSVSTRLIHHCPDRATYIRRYEEYYSQTCSRLDSWSRQLPSYLSFNSSTLDTAIQQGYAGVLLSIYTLYHSCIILLNRRVRVDDLPAGLLRRNIARAVLSAQHLLSSARLLNHQPSQAKPFDMQHRQSGLDTNRTSPCKYKLTTPFPGLAFLFGVDVLTAGGSVANIPAISESTSAALDCLEGLSQCWASAKAQQRSVQGRLAQLTSHALRERMVGEAHTNGHINHTFNTYPSLTWRLDNPLESGVAIATDAIYGAPDDIFHAAVAHPEAEAAASPHI